MGSCASKFETIEIAEPVGNVSPAATVTKTITVVQSTCCGVRYHERREANTQVVSHWSEELASKITGYKKRDMVLT